MKTVLVSGATGYFGKYIVQALSHDFQVIAMSRSLEKLESMFPEENIIKCAVDLYDFAAVESALTDLCSKYKIHGLINNAYDLSPKTGFNTSDGALDLMSVDMMTHSFSSGLIAPLLLTQKVGVQMKKNKISGSIINISSMYGTVAPDRRLYEGKSTFNPVTYGMVKAGLDAMTRYVASFWGEHNIRCNSVAPGPFPNTETVSANATRDEQFLQRLKDKTTLGDVGHPRDLLGVIRLLLSEDSRFITGQVIGVDGGWTAI